jgi:uncharacterized protein
MIVDTSALIAYFAKGARAHAAVSAVIDSVSEVLVVSPYVVAEVDYLVGSRHGVQRELSVLRELSSGAWDLPHLDGDALAQARAVIERYADRALGVADASLVVLADRFRTKTIVTLDHRHFDVVRPLTGGRFRVLP